MTITTTFFRTLRDDAACTLDIARECTPMSRYALDLAQAYPATTPEALAVKLMTVWPGSDRALRRLVALAAIEEAGRHPLLAA